MTWAPARRRHGLRHVASGYPWIVPAMVVVVGLIYFSIGYTGFVSTQRWNGFILTPSEWVGASNFQTLLGDSMFWRALGNTAVFYVVTFTTQTLIGFVFAALMHSTVRLRGLYKVVIFVPTVLAPATMAPVFRAMFANNGDINSILSAVGLDGLTHTWLSDPRTALGVVMLATIWQWTGLTFILFYAAMSQIEPEIMEAARMDGAGNVRTLFSIVWPACRGTTLALATLGLIGALKTFDWPYLISPSGLGGATQFLGTYIYQTMMQEKNFGYAATISVALLVLALACGVAMSARSRREGRR
ncbi:sugar ABC transporter permease [Xylanimonas ulmi]|uniref:Carbohydrate ABC transporter membrane protein 1 (CUT1 family) n=2 Tax=Xylanimonas ulmi TaxID=228973 RepID=A0A4Q7M2M9_9MICO|nr:carbohydrate ABC transporter membrane protein 1 (CUT1 family) [Xylanibacterium ulmi]